MTAVQPVLYLPQPLAHQRALIDSPAQFKIARCGRRGGKSRAGLICALAGHGQGKHLGVLQGERVAWVSPDYKQSVAIWREEIKPRFANLQATDLNELVLRDWKPLARLKGSILWWWLGLDRKCDAAGAA